MITAHNVCSVKKYMLLRLGYSLVVELLSNMQV